MPYDQIKTGVITAEGGRFGVDVAEPPPCCLCVDCMALPGCSVLHPRTVSTCPDCISTADKDCNDNCDEDCDIDHYNDYDPFSIRKRKTEKDNNGDITDDTRYFYADLNGLPRIISEEKLAGSGMRFTHYAYAQELLLRDIDGKITYFIVGDNMNVIALADESGAITDRYDYTPYGQLISHTGSDPNRILYSTEPNDKESGLIYLRKRYYCPNNSIFISKDTIKSPEINRYIYCDNNPIYQFDPSGAATIHIYYAGDVRQFDKSFTDRLEKNNSVKYIKIDDNNIKYARGHLEESLKSADYIIIRGHGGYNKNKYVFGFENNKITYINFHDIRIALSNLVKSESEIKTKLIFADNCKGVNIHSKRFMTSLKSNNIRYFSSGMRHFANPGPINFVINDIKRMDVGSNLDYINYIQEGKYKGKKAYDYKEVIP